MREDLLNELETEYEQKRARNERTEAERRRRIETEYPEIDRLVKAREELIFGTLRQILDQKAAGEDLPGKMEEKNREIREALKKNGLAEDYLSPVYECEKCRDTGYTGELIKEPCECLVKAYQQKVRERIGLSEGKKETFETYDPELIPETVNPESGISQRKQTAFVRDECEKWADAFPEVKHRDLLLIGKSGLGKTFLMHAMANRLIERGKNVLIISAYAFLQMARKSYFESETGVSELMDAPVLMLDDLGSEPMMQNVTIEQLFNLLNERQTRNLSTVISTNLNMEELRKRYTERIISRLNNPRNCLILTLNGQDLRKLER
jgi:DNA replication protein DnaC